MALPITVFGRPGCMDTLAASKHLRELGVAFREVNIDEDLQGESFVKYVNGGQRATPTIVVGSGKTKLILTEPSNTELDRMLAGQLGIA